MITLTHEDKKKNPEGFDWFPYVIPISNNNNKIEAFYKDHAREHALTLLTSTIGEHIPKAFSNNYLRKNYYECHLYTILKLILNEKQSHLQNVIL